MTTSLHVSAQLLAKGKSYALQVAQLRTIIETDQQMLIQFAEEKMALACQCFDLVDMHLMQIDRDIDTFDAEIQVTRTLLQCQCVILPRSKL